MAINLHQVQAAEFLLSRGADVHASNAKGDTAFYEVAGGILQPRETYDKKIEGGIRAQDEMVTILQEVSGDDRMMDQPDAAGRTPRQLRSETRSRWRQIGADAVTGRGRGRA
ncbi:hypothetical protein Asppvi_004471 [Aspergillus pseudoviridinutans]|uniref:Ankyrin repeat domain-containing protein n=1 Tax=Aspergillus pseudoviridinutans TaxID=1517512 RepID=A0A9P3ETE5_9EURO|nr:uncharacterized protein Asppvi_004471 [Aspergillus pseudoviridinutans]GIJ85612.1 hypothetical protein Asppvi_004471 [Aspergillus pseudoviridinutans]